MFRGSAAPTELCGCGTWPGPCAPPAAAAACWQQFVQTWRTHRCSAAGSGLRLRSSSSSVRCLAPGKMADWWPHRLVLWAGCLLVVCCQQPRLCEQLQPLTESTHRMLNRFLSVTVKEKLQIVKVFVTKKQKQETNFKHLLWGRVWESAASLTSLLSSTRDYLTS